MASGRQGVNTWLRIAVRLHIVRVCAGPERGRSSQIKLEQGPHRLGTRSVWWSTRELRRDAFTRAQRETHRSRWWRTRETRSKSRRSQSREAKRKAPPQYYFIYKTRIKNNHTSAITQLDWDYVFFERGTDNEVGRQEFTSDEQIPPGKTKELTVTVTTPPARTVSVTSLNLEERDRLSEKIVLIRISTPTATSGKRLKPQKGTRKVATKSTQDTKRTFRESRSGASSSS